MFAMWNGKGLPSTAGEAIPMTARIMQVAFTAVMFALHANTEVAVAEARRRAGTQLDPSLADLLISRAEELLGDLDQLDAHQAVLAAEPAPVRRVEQTELSDVARTFGNLVGSGDACGPSTTNAATAADITAATPQRSCRCPPACWPARTRTGA